MILYEEDWKKYPKAIKHFETKNRSFLIFAGKLKKMGVKNHFFHLALHNPDLKDVDPYDPNLTKEQKLAIAAEVAENPWYYFREVARAPAESGTTPNRLIANRGNISYFWLFFNNLIIYLIQPRQTGKSFNSNLLIAGMASFWTRNASLGFLTKDLELKQESVRRIKSIMDTYPDYLDLRTKKDPKNLEQIRLIRTNNRINLYVGQSHEKGALKVGRGMTSSFSYIDEFAYVGYNFKILPSMLGSSVAAMDAAKRNNVPHGIIYTTTPGRLHTREGRYAYEVYEDAARWNEKFFDAKNKDELIELLVRNKPRNKGKVTKQISELDKLGLVVLLEYNHRQLGYSDEWLLEKIAITRSQGEDAEVDFLNKWSSGTDNAIFDDVYLEAIEKSIKEYSIEIGKHSLTIRWYKDKEKINNKALIMGLDTSEAIGKDDIGLTIRDYETGEVVAAGRYNNINTNHFAMYLVDWFKKFPNLILIIEKKSTATGILDLLIDVLPRENINPYSRIFNRISDNIETKQDMISEFKKEGSFVDTRLLEKNREYFGYPTTGSGRYSRNNLYGETLLEAVKYTGSSVNDKDLANQIMSLELKNGRIDHKYGNHDDLVISWMLNYWFLRFAKNKELYGLDPTKALSNVVIVDKNTKDAIKKEEYIKEQQRRLYIINRYVDKLKNTKDVIERNKLIRMIRKMNSLIDHDVVQPLNVDAIVENLDKKYLNAA